MLGAAHKPGAMPLRPLSLGDMYDAAFRIIRFNPKATVGSAVLVAAVAMAIPVVITAVLDRLGQPLARRQRRPGRQLGRRVRGLARLAGARARCCASFGTILVTGMIAHVTAAAAVGRRLTLGEAWAATRGKRWRLVGLAFLLGFSALLLIGVYVLLWVLVVVGVGDNTALVVIWGLVSVPAFLCLMVWFWVRIYYLPVPALMLEPVGIFGAIGRGFRLTRQQFWRTFGIALLTLLVVGIAGNVLGVPHRHRRARWPRVAVGAQYALLVLVITQALVAGDLGGVRHPVHLGGDLAPVPRPADAQGGLRRRADAAGRDHGVVIWLDPPLDPSGSEARSKLRRELLHPEYHQQNLLQQIFDWIERQVSSGLDAASEAPPLSTLTAMVIFVGLVAALAWLASRARRTARDREEKRAVLTDGGRDRRRAARPGRGGAGGAAGSRRRWSRRSGRSRSARSSAAGSSTPPVPPPTRSRSTSPRSTPPWATGSRRARCSSTRCCTATGRPPASRPCRCWPSTTTWSVRR